MTPLLYRPFMNDYVVGAELSLCHGEVPCVMKYRCVRHNKNEENTRKITLHKLISDT